MVLQVLRALRLQVHHAPVEEAPPLLAHRALRVPADLLLQEPRLPLAPVRAALREAVAVRT